MYNEKSQATTCDVLQELLWSNGNLYGHRGVCCLRIFFRKISRRVASTRQPLGQTLTDNVNWSTVRVITVRKAAVAAAVVGVTRRTRLLQTVPVDAWRTLVVYKPVGKTFNGPRAVMGRNIDIKCSCMLLKSYTVKSAGKYYCRVFRIHRNSECTRLA